MEWQGTVMNRGYGVIGYGDVRQLLVHRAVWSVENQCEAPREMDICHRCDNRRCGLYAHLFDGTRAENMLDAKTKGRTTWGEKNFNAKLTERQVVEILRRRRAGEPAVLIAAEFRIRRETVYDIAQGRRWERIVMREGGPIGDRRRAGAWNRDLEVARDTLAQIPLFP